jgi:lysophospholipase L1-like esterase
MNAMRRLIALAAVLSGCSVDKVTDDVSIKEVVTGYYDGIRLRNHKKMVDTTTPDFILYEEGNIWNNDSVFHEMERYQFSVNYTFSDFAITIDSNKAYASYHVLAKFVFDDTLKRTYNFVETAAFEKSGDNWRMDLLQVNQQLPRYDTIHYAPDYYAARVAHFKSEPIETGRLVLLGNSLIEYGDWTKLFSDSSIVNRGVAADNTFGVLKRLDDIIARQPSNVIIEIGINDVSQNMPIDIVVDNITEIVKKLHSECPRTGIFVVGLLPTNDDVKNEYPDVFNKNRMSDVVNALLKLRAKPDLFAYVDLNSKLRDPQGKLNVKVASSDGLHLNEEGYRIFGKLLSKCLED